MSCLLLDWPLAWPLLPLVRLPISSCFQDAELGEIHIQRPNTTAGPLESPQGRRQPHRVVTPCCQWVGVKDTTPHVRGVG